MSITRRTSGIPNTTARLLTGITVTGINCLMTSVMIIPAHPCARCSMSDTGAAFGIGVFIILAALTSYGIWMGFGPESKKLVDPFDDHDD